MKKIVVIAGLLVCGLMAQASTVAWSLSNVKGPNGDALDTGSVYVFFVAGGAKADTSSWSALAEKGVASLTAAVAGANYSYSLTDAAGTFTRPAMALSDVGVSPATKYSVYAVIFDTVGITDDSNYYVTAATAASTTFADASALTKTYSLSATTSSDAANWKGVSPSGGVPEPTSGILLLLGVAGLALRRKQA